MKMLFSKSECGFYDREITANIPADAVEISREQWQALLEGQSQGKVIAADARGFPVLKDPPPPTPIVPRSVTMRQARLALLAAGHYEKVQAAFASLPADVRAAAEIEWEYAGTVERDSAFTKQMAAMLGLDETALDSLFTAAAQL